MKLDVLSISIDRENGREIEKKVVGQKVIENERFGAGCVGLLTGLSVEECYRAIAAQSDIPIPVA